VSNIILYILTSTFLISGSIGLLYFYDNLIKLIISVEVIFLAGLLNLLNCDSEFRDIFFFSGLSVATAETAIGLSLMVSVTLTSPIVADSLIVQKNNFL